MTGWTLASGNANLLIKTGVALGGFFSGSPPFGGGRNKSEFPDALVLASLVAWLRPERPRMYVVDPDPDLTKFRAGRDDLILLASVPEPLSLALASPEMLSRLDAHVRDDRRFLDGHRSRRADADGIDFSGIEVDSVLVVDEPEGGGEYSLEVGIMAQVQVDVSQTGHEYVILLLCEPDIDIATHGARSNASAYVHL